MSEAIEQPSTETVAPAPTGNADWDAAVQQAASENSAPEANAAPAEENTAETEAPAVAEPPAPASDYTFSTLQNGEQEIRLATGEVYRGKTEREVIEKMAMGKIEASRTIKDLREKQPKQETAPSPTSTESPSLDPTTLAIIDLIAPGFGAKSGQELIAKFQQLDQKQNEFGEVAEHARLQSLAANFVSSTPDFVLTQGNAQKLEQALDQYGLPPTMQNLQLVHNALKGQGVYEVLPPRAENGRFQPKNTMPPPPAGASPSASTGKGAPTDADLWAMSPEKLLEFIQASA